MMEQRDGASIFEFPPVGPKCEAMDEPLTDRQKKKAS